MDKPFQRKGAESNAHVGREFESWARAFFATQGLTLTPGIAIDIGINGKKAHKFDLGSNNDKIIVECKAHTWTESGGVPVAKMTTWNEVMYFFCAAPTGYRKILFVLRDFSQKKKETLAAYYIRTNSHLIPADVEIWEYDAVQKIANQVR
jgi:hypothetical protein